MEDYLVLENPRRRRRTRRRTPPRGAGGRFRRRRRRRNPTLTAANPRRRRTTRRRRRRNVYAAAPVRRRNPRRRVTRRRRRRNPGFLPGRGEVMGAVRKGTQILVAEFAGDVVTRIVGKFAGPMMMGLPIRPDLLGPVVRMGVGILAPPIMKAVAPRMFKRDFRQMFAAVNVASGLMALTMPMREQAFAAMRLPSSADTLGDYYGPPSGVLGEGYYGPPSGVLGDYVTADGGVGDYVTAGGGVGY